MSVLKCKICGGIVEPQDNGIGVCDSCGTKQTIPKFGNDRVNSFLEKANNFRNAGEFDKAIDIYEKLLDNNEAEDPELYWNIVLSKYGVKYEKDPSSKEYIPTVNRLQFTSILQDNDYKKALELADGEQKKVYIEQAEAIDKIQQEILRISKSEVPYDIFICYKESDENGKRTQDSLYAYKLYEKLTNEGYKVFFARVTLEDKIGKYEPYIFAALHSAKVMLVIGTKKEYFDAVWVKNEWSRYLQLLKDKSVKRNIVPCYKDMDPYDLPEELAYLQAQDMNRVGFEEDLIRGISKIVKVKKVNDSQNVDINNLEISRLLKRIKTYIDDGDFINANQYCEKALDIDAENADVYFYQLLAQKGVKSLEEMNQKFIQINDDDPIYRKIIKFGNQEIKDELFDVRKNYIIKITDNYINGKKYDEALNCVKGLADDFKCKNELLSIITEKIYNIANEECDKGDLTSAISIFSTLKGFMDIDTEIEKCNTQIEELRKKQLEIKQKEIQKLREEREIKINKIKETSNNVFKKIYIVALIVFEIVVLMQYMLGFGISGSGLYKGFEIVVNTFITTDKIDSILSLSDYILTFVLVVYATLVFFSFINKENFWKKYLHSNLFCSIMMVIFVCINQFSAYESFKPTLFAYISLGISILTTILYAKQYLVGHSNEINNNLLKNLMKLFIAFMIFVFIFGFIIPFFR